MNSYSQAFFSDITTTSTRSANRSVELLKNILRPNSLVDVGCGVGSWGAAFSRAGVREVVGIDGAWVPLDALQIPRESFHRIDLLDPKQLDRRFDVAICLEVAEHLPESAGEKLLELLTAASDAILFSAAIPGQGGTGHVNEQWPQYWTKRFNAHGYQLYDVVRPILFEDPVVAFWYAQNTMIFARPTALKSGVVSISSGLSDWRGAPIVHPRLLRTAINSQRIVPREWLSYGLRQLIPDLINRMRGRSVRIDPRDFALGSVQGS